MQSEIRDLMERAKNGDNAAGQAMVNSGIDCHRSGDIAGTIEWWEAAANADVGDAIWNLTYIVYGNPDVGKADADRFMHWLNVLANEWKNPPSMVTLGAILCGSTGNHYVNTVYPQLVSAYDPKNGFALIEDAVRRAENKERYSQNPLNYNHYSDMSDAYNADTGKRAGGRSADMYFKGFSHVAALAKRLIYNDRAIDAVKEGRGTHILNQDQIIQISALYQLSNEKMGKEMIALLKSVLQRELAIDGLSIIAGSVDRPEIGADTLKDINHLRNTGKIDEWEPAGKDELADVLEKYLRAALDEVM